MNILLVSPRFFPAISGGDFLFQKIGQELQRLKNVQSTSNMAIAKNEKLNVLILTTDALDFTALHGIGKRVALNHRNYSSYQNLSVQRYRCLTKTLEYTRDSKTDDDVLQLKSLIETIFRCQAELYDFFIENGPVLPDLTKELKEIHEAKNFTSIIYKFKPDIIHCGYLPYSTLIYCLLIGRILNIPTSVTPFLHAANPRYQNETIFHLLCQFDAIFACTHVEKEIYIQQGIRSEQVFVIPMGVDIKRFTMRNYQIDFHRIFHPKAPIILFCGNKNYEKGALTILDSIPILESFSMRFDYVFIGSSTKAFNLTMSKLKRQYPQINIINISPENQESIYDPLKIGAFQSAEIFCMPSRSDAYGIVYLEAWACKKPVIGADFPVMREVISSLKDGLLVEFGNSRALAEAIIYLEQNPLLREQMGSNGFKKIQMNQWRDIVNNINSVYQMLVKL